MNTLKEKVIEYWDMDGNQIIAKDKQFISDLVDATAFMSITYSHVKKLSNRHRMYAIKHDILSVDDIPKCHCGKHVAINGRNPHDGFAVSCSEECNRTKPKISKEAQTKIADYDWLYSERISKKKSYQSIADDIGVSEPIILNACRSLNLPVVHYNKSDYKNQVSLGSTVMTVDEMCRLYMEDGLTLDQIGDMNGVSKSWMSIVLSEHPLYIPRTSSDYEYEKTRTSKQEDALYEWIKSIYHGEVIRSYRVLESGHDKNDSDNKGFWGNREIDIYFPSIGFGIEYNGLAYHVMMSEFMRNHRDTDLDARVKGRRYHWQKKVAALKIGIELVHIWSDQWVHTPDKVKSFIMTKLGLNKKIYARNCTIECLNPSESLQFFDTHHFQSGERMGTHYCLMCDGEIVAAMSMGKPRFTKKYDWELIRFCGKGGVTVVGGFSKLLKHVRSIYKGSIVSYADFDISLGNVYVTNGFEEVKRSGPSYCYVNLNKEIREYRTNYTKQSLAKMGLDVEGKSEDDLTKEIGLRKLWTCGTITYVIN